MCHASVAHGLDQLQTALYTEPQLLSAEPVYQCEAPPADGFELAQICSSGTFAGEVLYCDPSTALPGGVTGLLSLGAEVRSSNSNLLTACKAYWWMQSHT